MTKNYHVGVADISFYLTDEDGNIKEDKNGNEIEYRLKDGIRFKPLEYITEDLTSDMLEPTKKAIDKLKKIKEILKLNIKQWDETQHDPVEEFKLLVEIIEEK
jgi:hypothetical protein